MFLPVVCSARFAFCWRRERLAQRLHSEQEAEAEQHDHAYRENEGVQRAAATPHECRIEESNDGNTKRTSREHRCRKNPRSGPSIVMSNPFERFVQKRRHQRTHAQTQNEERNQQWRYAPPWNKQLRDKEDEQVAQYHQSCCHDHAPLAQTGREDWIEAGCKDIGNAANHDYQTCLQWCQSQNRLQVEGKQK